MHTGVQIATLRSWTLHLPLTYSCNLSLSCERSPADTVVAHVTQAVSCLLAMDAARGDASKREAAYQARAVQQSERKHLRLHRQESVFVVAKR